MELDGQRYLAFASNDYLGLANHPALVDAARGALEQYGVGATAAPLVCGHTQAVAQLERDLAAHVGMDDALHFSSGYMANLGVIPALLGRGDLVLVDRLDHACLIDSARLSGASLRVYPHGDLDTLERQLAKARGRRVLVATDAVFSMDGDIAPLPAILALCERHDAWLLVDDAHGFGVLGPQGRGSLAHFGLRSDRIIYMGTLGKAAGVAGAFVAANAAVIAWLQQRARTYVFSTASPPVQVSPVGAALALIRDEEWRREHLAALIAQLRQGLAGLPWRLLPSDTPIQVLVVGDEQRALDLMQALRERGIWVPAIRPPTVPRNGSRLRICLSAAHTADDVHQLTTALAALAAQSRTP
jgi:8-amino-7-oxononanoate synthase